jgi:hypothetical protein
MRCKVGVLWLFTTVTDEHVAWCDVSLIGLEDTRRQPACSLLLLRLQVNCAGTMLVLIGMRCSKLGPAFDNQAGLMPNIWTGCGCCCCCCCCCCVILRRDPASAQDACALESHVFCLRAAPAAAAAAVVAVAGHPEQGPMLVLTKHVMQQVVSWHW